MNKHVRVAFVSTYPPRQCGIGTFTHDLLSGIQEIHASRGVANTNLEVVAMDSAHYRYDYPPEVRLQIRDHRMGDYREAAEFLNLSPVGTVSLQHEYGIFGGEDGSHVIYLLRALKRPVVTTLHTVMNKPTPGQRETLRTICALSTFVVVQAQRAVDMLHEVFSVPRRKIVMIHHGTPDVPFLDPAFYKDQCGAEGRRMILTFGLINPNKGIEHAIEALSKVVADFPDVLYTVLGATHPEVKRRLGESYRLSLEQLVKEKGLENNVVFHNQFVTKEQLIKFLVAADIYLTPYLSKQQIVSGTLAYAVACGKAVVSTPYWYAEELLADDKGVLIPFRDSDALAAQLKTLLADQRLRDRIRKRAYRFGRQMTWREVAGSYLKVFENAMEEYGMQAVAAHTWVKATDQPSLPDVNLNHLRAMTDDVGMLQHAFFTTPDRIHGYCTDDNARALIVATMNWHLLGDESILPLLQTYLAFVNHAIDRETGRIRNFMSYDRRWTEDVGSEDSQGRTVWALGHCAARMPTDAVFSLATRLFNRALAPSAAFKSPRAASYVVLGCLEYLNRFGGDREAMEVAYGVARRLVDQLRSNTSRDWVWFEDILSYDNARLPQALIAAGRRLKDEELLQDGLRSLEWLLSVQTDPKDGHISLVGTAGWYCRGGERARFDQQPLEISALIDACYEAYLATGEERWSDTIERCFNWFFGRNDVRKVMYDFASGGCYDGLHPTGVNQNEGAESTLSWLMALHRMHQVRHEKIINAATTPTSNREVAATSE